MHLYHGTSSKHLPSILEHGLLPRRYAASNWEAASSADRVYFTNAYGMYFSQAACRGTNADLVIVEIDTDLLPDLSRLQADEDCAWFMWQHGAIGKEFHPPLGMDDKYDQAMHFSKLLGTLSECGLGYEQSLEFLGNCSYEGSIPREAITKIVRYSAARGPWWVSFHDPIISPMNFRFHGSEYQATQLVVADRLEEARQVIQLMPSFLNLDTVEQMCATYRTLIPLPVPPASSQSRSHP